MFRPFKRKNVDANPKMNEVSILPVFDILKRLVILYDEVEP